MTQPKRNSRGQMRCLDKATNRTCIATCDDEVITELSELNITDSSGNHRKVFADEVIFNQYY